MLHFPSNLRLIRLLSGQTQTEFGALFDATKAMIISYEKGKAMPDELFMSRLCKYTGAPKEDLLQKRLSEEDLQLGKVEKLENGVNEGIKKPGPHEPDWKDFALEMKELASGWKDLATSQKVFIDQMERVSFNLNKLLLGASSPQETAASELPVAAQELLETGRSGPFQMVGHSGPVGSSDKKGS
jgi:transcriptional regulator with XRE-family HTH domain